MTKRTKILLTDKEVDELMNVFNSKFMEIGDNDEWNEPYAKTLGSVHEKIVKGKNKNGIWYLFQLKDREGEIIRSNIRDEYLKTYDQFHK